MTPNNGILAIPEATVQGSGMYIVPENKYSYFCGNVVSATHAWFGSGDTPNSGTHETENYFSGNNANPSATTTGTANNHTQWLTAGDVITTSSNTTPSQTTSVSQNQMSTARYGGHYAFININAVPVCVARSGGSISSNSSSSVSSKYTSVRGNITIGWSVAEFPIPKNNLHEKLIEGN